MSQPIRLRSWTLKFLVFSLICLLGYGLYIVIDRYIINPEISAVTLDTGTRAVQFDKAPPIHLVDITGKEINIENFRDKVVIVNFWSTTCPPCVEEFPSLVKYANMFDQKIVILAIAQDRDISLVKDFLSKYYKAPSPSIYIMLDINGLIGKNYGISALPESFIFSNNLQFKRKIIGYRDWLSPVSIKEARDLIAEKTETN